ncbi:mitochondrial carrier protein-like protein [Aulographum hederae CBS 113979]|uniref:Mitochondrial carrier protein-like protein n=1 Tax=Aulographum hederae CBS 113979 TaxID=1176131 RepID=A0A6G1GYR3_9PEZI|nr:mitochondrial carrier protein-like protein [Aulographum hederae CBS 113979]
MSADFWAGYLSGAAGILIGNPLDLIKTRLQAGAGPPQTAKPPSHGVASGGSSRPLTSHFDRTSTLVRGVTAPILGYGALNAILYVSYNRTLSLLSPSPSSSPSPLPEPPSFPKIWAAGAIGGLATFIVSAPTELVKCRVQVAKGEGVSSWGVAREIWRREGVRGLYWGGGVTAVRDAVGYGFYFWSYELSKQALTKPDDTDRQAALKVLLCGGLAGVVTWASIFPLDVIKTRVQTQELPQFILPEEERPLRGSQGSQGSQSADRGYRKIGAIEMARKAYQTEGYAVFFRGLGICSVRAFIVNAVQWAVYEWMMRILTEKKTDRNHPS